MVSFATMLLTMFILKASGGAIGGHLDPWKSCDEYEFKFNFLEF